MLSRAALRPLVFKRSFAAAARLRAGPAVPVIQGQGAPAGAVPSDLDQSTGIERMELLAKLEGKDPFLMEPLPLDRLGTLKEPIIVQSFDDYRIVGCSGYPSDSHDVLFFKVKEGDKPTRCPECGGAYKLEFLGDPNAAAHGHH